MKKYNHNKIEKIVQKYWKKYNIFKVKLDKKKKKYYCLCMLPYPSGNLHIGHVRNYTIGDIISRYQRLKKKNVLHPIGWDSFGLPAEIASINNNISPKKWTKKNIKYMKKQLKKIGISYDWNREINTCKSKYYKWEQLLFIKLFKKKLIYKKKKIINWCPIDKTVLANEQVINNKCWRCNSIIKYKKKSQWFIKITKYANKLNNDLNKLNKWPKKVINMQKKWIGKYKGLELNINIYKTKKKIKIFIKNINLLISTLCISISINNKIINFIKKKNPNIFNKIKNKIYKNNIKNINKCIGINTNLYIKNPITKHKIPIWITNFTEELYNTNAILICPNFNKQHNYFIKKYKLIKLKKKKINIKNIKKYLIKKKLIKKKIIFKLKDWVISRQRYWGVPIPIIKNNNKYKTIKKNKLPVKFPKIKNINSNKNFLKKIKKWKKIKLKNKIWKKETDTLDTFMESSWYYIRYTCPKYKKNIFKSKKANYWLPIDTYIGGIEHATMHLIYFRFIHKFFKNIGLIKSNEPVKRLICQGIVLSDTYYYFKKNKKIWISQKNVKKIYKNNKTYFYLKNKNIKLIYSGKNKMSKSKNNGINPLKIINKYGADTLRLFIIFSAPINENLYWNDLNIKGCYRFINKLWILIFNFKKKKKINYNKKINIKKYYYIKYKLNKIIKETTYILNKKNNFNTIISKIMIFFNLIKKNKKIKNKKIYNLIKKCINTIIILIYPFCPHITFYLWKKMKNKKIIDNSLWPKINKKKIIIKKKIKIILQINGKTKKIIKIKNTLNKKKILIYIYKNKNIKIFLKNKKIKNIIYIKNKIINFIT